MNEEQKKKPRKVMPFEMTIELRKPIELTWAAPATGTPQYAPSGNPITNTPVTDVSAYAWNMLRLKFTTSSSPQGWRRTGAHGIRC
ncbi:hypothetical protein [Paraburkholderia fungorum]|uniref:Uncharacterized protein n=1 Tax=Paraburkholderia fungorum TaxID=134537 RepID=A0A3R7F6W9_9BURK|nr:hypothetical protein [Paraburkholderia fungorum]RKF43530.1 hypothetical protein BCY88_05990 [Paraburkholderia fungorum]